MKPTGTRKKRQQETLKKFKDYAHKPSDEEIAASKDYHKLDKEIAEYVARNKPTQGTKKNEVEEERPKKLKDYEDHNKYKIWFFAQSHATLGAELAFVLREYNQLEQLCIQGLIFSPAHFETCLFLKEERKRLEHILHEEAAASVAAASVKPGMRIKNATRVKRTRAKIKQLMEEGETHLKSWQLFDWGSLEEFAKDAEPSMKKELVAEKQKDEGWEEQEDEKSAIKQVMKEGKEHRKNLELYDPDCTLLEEKIAKGEASMKKELVAEKQKEQVMKEEQEHRKNLELYDPDCTLLEEKIAKGEASMKSKPTKGTKKKKEEEILKKVKDYEDHKLLEYKRWSLEEEVHNLIDKALENSFPLLGEKSKTFFTCKEDYGDYQCENVLSIWPKLIEKGTELKGPKSVGMAIKTELENRSDMIEETPCVRSFGFVTFKLSGKWMAKSLNKMVRYGIDTWAPKLGFKRVIVEMPDDETSILGTIRSNFIKDTFIRMLEYSQVSVKSSKDEFLRDVLSHVLDDEWSFSIKDIDGDAVASPKVEGKLESLNFGKREIQDVSDSLKILCYALKVERADWIVCLNPVRHQEYVEMRFIAAKHAGWISTAEDHKLSFAGYRTPAEAGKLVCLLENALSCCNSLVKQGKAPEYTADRVFWCTLGYEFLKAPRMAESSFNIDEMFNEKGNTFFYLLNTKSEVISVLANSGKGINLKNVSELILEKVEVLEEDGGRALVFHLLRFAQVLEESCLSVLPHILCRYLHDLSHKFTSYNSTYSCVSEEDGSVAETSRLILCEATAVVMEKCFHLLGITPVSISGESLIEPLEILSELKSRMGPKDLSVSCYDSVIPLARHPPRNPRFEIMTICPEITRDFKSGKLFGCVLVQDKPGFLSDGWVPTFTPDIGMVALFSSEWYDSVEMVNDELVFLGNPMSRHSVPLSTSTLRMRAELVITSETEDEFYHLKSTKRLKLPDFRDIKGDGECGTIDVDGKHMSVTMYCITLKDAVDTDVEVKFMDIDAHRKVEGHIYAYYGSKFPYANEFDVDFYTTSLLEPSTITAGPVRLSRSKIAVPKHGSLVIEAKLVDVISRKVVLAGRHEFPAKIRSDSRHTIRGKIRGCSLHLKVDWNYKA